jgi:hypothetical protein
MQNEHLFLRLPFASSVYELEQKHSNFFTNGIQITDYIEFLIIEFIELDDNQINFKWTVDIQQPENLESLPDQIRSELLSILLFPDTHNSFF